MLNNRLYFCLAPEIGLLQHEHDILLPPMAEHTKKVPSGRGPGIHDREDEDDQIGKWYEASGNILVTSNDGVGAGSIDNVEVF